MQHEADGRQGDHCLGDFEEFLVILGQTSVPSKPAERSFDDPSPGRDDEADPGDAANDDQGQAEPNAGKQDRQAVVDAVGAHGLQPAVQRLDLAQQVRCAVGILDVGGVDDDAQQEAGGVNRDVALAPFDLFGRLIAARPPFSVVFTLWVSMMATVGLGSRPSCSRSMVTR